jgi:hypothetical protein
VSRKLDPWTPDPDELNLDDLAIEERVLDAEPDGDTGETSITNSSGDKQSLIVDSLGWLGDLIRALVWTGVQDPLPDPCNPVRRAGIHLLHNMFGKGEPITVPCQVR